MYQINNITGGNVTSYDFVGNIYTGRVGDSCNITNTILLVSFLWNANIRSMNYPIPPFYEIFLIEANIVAPTFTIEWQNGVPETHSNIAGLTLSRKRKIFLTSPIPEEKTSLQIFSHELGHWCFDRFFDQYMNNNVRRNGTWYLRYSEASAFFVEESLTGNQNNLGDMDEFSMSGHYEGLQILRSIQGNSSNVLQTIFNDYLSRWNNHSEDDETP